MNLYLHRDLNLGQLILLDAIDHVWIDPVWIDPVWIDPVWIDQVLIYQVWSDQD
ncbi:MAG: hypothetical protein RLY44_304 [Actinomycetota bacterium]